MSATVILTGNLGKEPEQRETTSGMKVTDISVAVNLGKDKDGSDKEPNWYKCSLFGKSGEFAAKYLHKGSLVKVVGNLTANDYNGKTFLNVSAYEVKSLSKLSSESDEDFPF